MTDSLHGSEEVKYVFKPKTAKPRHQERKEVKKQAPKPFKLDSPPKMSVEIK